MSKDEPTDLLAVKMWNFSTTLIQRSVIFFTQSSFSLQHILYKCNYKSLVQVIVNSFKKKRYIYTV